MNMFSRSASHVVVAVLFVLATVAISPNKTAANVPQFNIVRPSTTGVPGEEVRLMKFDPSGNLWVAARYYFWQEWGLAMLSADQLEHHPLPGGGYDTCVWKVWSSINSPLPSQYMYDMEFASDGTIWIASDGGLTRFRPNAIDPADQWFTYTPGNSPLLRPGIRSIAIDSQGNIWMVNELLSNAFTYLYKFSPTTNQWTTVNPGQYPYNVAVGNNDHIFISMTMVGGIMEFDGNSWVHHPVNPPANPYQMSSIMQDAQGNVWAIPGYGSYGLWKWNGSSWQNWPLIGGTQTITGISKNNAGEIYISTWYGGIYKMVNDQPVFFVNADNIPREVVTARNGDIWINNYGGNGTLGGARHYTAAGQLLSKFQTFNTGLPDYFVDHIKSDSSGNMWFATGEGGLSRMLGSNGSPDAPTHWRNWGAHNFGAEPYPFAPSEPMYSLFEDTGGIFWMAGNGVGRWDSATGEFTNFWNTANSNLDSSGMNVIIKRGDTAWVGTGGSGVSWLNGNNWTRVYLSSPYNYDANHVNAMAVDTASNLWVGSRYGLRKFAPGDNANFTEYNTGNSPLPSAYILDVIADPSGGIWIGTAAGLVRYDGSTWTTYNQANTGMPGTTVTSVARRSSDGLIAIGSYQGFTAPYTGGVSTFDGQTWTHYTPQNSPLAHWQVVDVEFDTDGDLWASPMSTGVVEIMINRPQVGNTAFDYDGDGRADISVFRPSQGTWYLQRSRDGFAATGWGISTDKITPADYDGDGKTDIAVYRSGTWYLLRSSLGFTGIAFGDPTDIPQPADFDGDGKAELAVFRPSNGTWYVLNLVNNQFTGVPFGASSDAPVAGDYDGDGKADYAVYRNGTWYLLRSTLGFTAIAFGVSTDKPVVGDYDGDGKADLAVFRPSSGTWYLQQSTAGFTRTQFGIATDLPAPADYDGDGKMDIAVFRDGSWYQLRSTQGFVAVQFGAINDKPVPSAFVP